MVGVLTASSDDVVGRSEQAILREFLTRDAPMGALVIEGDAASARRRCGATASRWRWMKGSAC
jgi:hypothetical protein